MKRILTQIMTFIAALMTLSGASGQTTEARMVLDTNSIMIGDQVNLSIELDVPGRSTVDWPFFLNDTVATGVEIIKDHPVDSVNLENGYIRIHQKLVITSFDSGYHTIAPVPFNFYLEGDTTKYKIQSNPVFLNVEEPEVDLASDIKVIKSPLEAPVTLQEVLAFIVKWILPVLIALIVIAAGVYIYIKRKKNQPLLTLRPRPVKPPHKKALEDLETLRLKKLWQAGRVKDYYSELTEIVRWYIEERFGVQALEMTTDEIINGLKKLHIQEETLNRLRQTLIVADLVKFAKENPLPDENDRGMKESVDFVEKTKPVPVPEEQTTSQLSGGDDTVLATEEKKKE